jgi:hypothetical protein
MKKKLILLTIFTQEIKLLNIDLTKKIASKISNTTAELIENPITKFYKDLQEVGQLLSLGEALIQNHLKAFLMLLDMHIRYAQNHLRVVFSFALVLAEIKKTVYKRHILTYRPSNEKNTPDCSITPFDDWSISSRRYRTC